MERILDIQYRLLREELICPIRSSISSVVQDLSSPPHVKTPLSTILKKSGGLYHSKETGIRFSVYTDVTFGPMRCDSQRGLSVQLSFDAPNGPARNQSANKRVAYWEGVGKKRLMQGGLVALLWKPAVTADPTKVYLAVISSSLQDLLDNVKRSAERISVQVSFFESEADLRILHSMLKQEDLEDDTRLLIEAPVMFESLRPFLQTLKTRQPTDVPFARYLAFPATDDLTSVTIDPPRYVTPGFKFDLSVLFDQPSIVPLQLFPMDPMSVERARVGLKEGSQLDPSQADALVDALTSEVSLIQGPPGTGKSYTGIKLLRVLIANKIGPILLIAFTNHALDNILSQVLEKGISRKIVRLGARSADENVAAYTLDAILKKLPRDRSGGAARGKMKGTEGAMATLMHKIARTESAEVDIVAHISLMHEQHHTSLTCPPSWIQRQFNESLQSIESGWQTAGRKGQEPKTLLAYWQACKDLAFLTPPDPPPPPKKSGREGKEKEEEKMKPDTSQIQYHFAERDNDELAAAFDTQDSSLDQWWKSRIDFFIDVMSEDMLPALPDSERDLDDLLDDPEVWDMSQAERLRLAAYWANQAREHAYSKRTEEFDKLKEKYSEERTAYTQITEKAKLEVLSAAELIGCTTNGAAKLTELLAGVAPNVLLVEEAGQVLEAHVLSGLVPSIQHMILIGDPLQLRPTVENYDLSVENKRTGRIYRFDRSVMERLSDMGLRMSRLDVQRRMRPEISELIRTTLYPNLEDNDVVRKYSSVRGMAKDVFFLDHRHPEGGPDDDSESVSKTNKFEVLMIKDLVLYLLQQGNHSDTGDIVVLCAYLGQLSQIRKALSNEVVTVIDERDAVLLVDEEDAGSDKDAPVNNQIDNAVSQVKVSTRVLLRTVDNFQGEEGKIVILSLVRNSGGNPSRGRGIGFLKSANRANVALSRAREGMYILGNADDLCSPKDCHFWRGVVEELKTHNQIGPALPVACNRHPTTITYITEPGQLPLCAPEGGCTLLCDQRLSCGHNCPLKCHSYDVHHTATTCSAPCMKLCPRDHPCDKPCYMQCGRCNFPMSMESPCGHFNDISCWQFDKPDSVRCKFPVKIELECGHATEVLCCESTDAVQCNFPASIEFACGHVKNVRCWQVGDPEFNQCDIPVSIELACGHANNIACWQRNDLESISCAVRISKVLPGCEHTAIMACPTDPTTVRCPKACDRHMACCDKRCQGGCADCQCLNHDVLPNGKMQRSVHIPHPCTKPLYCQHDCGGDCSDEHSCSTSVCKAQCRQGCQHGACNKLCSMPCTPCMEPCIWKCQHHECPVVCGAPCARLPCDKRCENQLACNHQCPSVCGEPCELQICPLCVNGKAKDPVGDNASRTTLDELLITLACRHTFTVEALDGICKLNQYYERQSGLWTDLATPPAGLQRAPVCPLCRVPITSLRYGRIIKRSDLDKSEQNVVNNGCRALLAVSQALATHKSRAGEAARLVKTAFQKRRKKKGKSKGKAVEDHAEVPSILTPIISTGETLPIPSNLLGADASSLFGESHGLPQSLVIPWGNAARRLFVAYEAAYKTAVFTSAHREVYDAVVSTLHRQIIATMATQGKILGDEPVADGELMAFAKSQCGLAAPPKADVRFRVEACWISFSIRFQLIELAQAVSAHLITLPDSRLVQPRWASFVDYIYCSVERDAELTIRLADESKSHRQAAKTVLWFMETVYLRFSTRVANETSAPAMELLKAEARHGYTRAKAMVADRTMVYRNAMNGNIKDVQWSSEKFVKPATVILNKWAALSRRLEEGTPLSDAEKREVIQTLRQWSRAEAPIDTRDQLYQCPNGHVYVAADCGGAANRSRCPECGAVMGGAGY